VKPAKLTLDRINATLEANQEREHRNHLGASVVGKPCSREIWYTFRWAKKELFEGQMLRLFDRGQLEENRFVALLKSIGCEVWQFDANGKQWRVSDCDGHFGGSLDGVARGIPDLPQDTPFLCEFKTHNEKSFKKLEEDGLMKTKWEHFIQCQAYMFKMGLKWCLYMAVNKNTDDLFLELIQLDEGQALQLIDRAKRIIESQEAPPRISKTPGFWTCKFCHYSRMCHFGDEQPERNCRTCLHSEPCDKGEWHCCKRELFISQDLMKVGCDQYEVNPALLAQDP
jgi:hypothetical protein